MGGRSLGYFGLCMLWLFAAAAAYTDTRSRRVPNRLVLAAAACGLTASACGGWRALAGGLAGLLLGFALLLPAFLLRMVGGGDVKSLAVIGLFTGPSLLWLIFLRGVVAGGVVAAVSLAARLLPRRRHPDREANARTLPYAAILGVTAAVSALLAAL